MLLEEASIQENESIVSWRANGKAFRVNDTDEFDRTILRRYFRQSKYKSFLRQLHIYGFNRIVKGKDKGSYYHELFVRHQPNLCMGMVRQKVKGNRQSVSSIKTNPTMSMTTGPKAVAQDQVVPSNKPPTALHEKSLKIVLRGNTRTIVHGMYVTEVMLGLRRLLRLQLLYNPRPTAQ